MANTKLQHEKPNESASKVTVHYDGKIRNLEVDENGAVKAENREQARQLKENHGQFFPLNDEEIEEMDHVLADKTVDEVEQYIADIEQVSRLKELRQEESRKTAVEAIDQRIAEVRENKEAEQEEKEVEEQDDEQEQDEVNQNDEVSNEDEEQDGEETEE